MIPLSGEANKQNRLISICIPTRNRETLLAESIKSCFESSYRPLEIVIGDDSDGDASFRMLAELSVPEGVSIVYVPRDSSSSQSRNVNRIIDRATGERLMLLHDDDLLLPDAVNVLAAAWDSAPQSIACVYGRQVLIDEDGLRLNAASETLNLAYARIASLAGPQQSSLEAALRQQIPNDCYLVDAELARRTRYRSESEVGHSVDADFGIRLALISRPREFVYVDIETSAYRISSASIMRSGLADHRHHLYFLAVERTPVATETEITAKEATLARIAEQAIVGAARAGDRRLAARILLSRHYRLSFSSSTAYRLALLISPRLADRLSAFKGGSG